METNLQTPLENLESNKMSVTSDATTSSAPLKQRKKIVGRTSEFDALKGAISKVDRKRDEKLMIKKPGEKALKVILGVTVKSIVENEHEGILDMAYTLTIKMLEDKHGDMSINVNKEGDVIPTYRNRRYNQTSGAIEACETKEGELISCSTHMNASVKVSSEIDLCPFIVSTYDLSIKLNSLNDFVGERSKVKTLFVSRYMDDYLQFQAGSLGRGVSKVDFVSVLGISKVKKDFEKDEKYEKMGHTKHEGLWVNLDDEHYETDEIVFRFVTRRKQLSNLVGVVLPCVLVPLIFGEISRRGGIDTEILLTGVLTLIFAMPTDFGYGTALWFSFAFLLCFLAYVVNLPVFGLIIECFSVGLGFLFLAFMFVYQKHIIKKNNEGGRQLIDLVKDAPEKYHEMTLVHSFVPNKCTVELYHRI